MLPSTTVRCPRRPEDKILEELKADGVNVIEVDDITPWQDACKDVIEEATKNNKELYQQIVDMQ